MAVNGPTNRRRKVAGKADESSMQLHGEGLGQGPVGQADGYKDRKEQQAQRPQSQPSGGQRPQGQATGGQRPRADWGAVGGQRPQAQRPAQDQAAQNQGQTGQDGDRGMLGSLLGAAAGGAAGSSGGGKKSGCSPILIIILVVVLLGGGGGLSGLFGNLFGGSNNSTVNNVLGNDSGSALGGLSSIVDTAGSLLGGGSGLSSLSSLLGGGTSSSSLLSSGLGGSAPSTGLLSSYSTSDLSSLLGGSFYGDMNGFTSPAATASTGTSASLRKLDRTVASGSRARYTKYTKNDPSTTFTILVYMCGADLESRSGMATNDLQEMLSASFGDNVRLIVYTGGAKQWRNSVVSSSVNQVYQVKGGKLVRLIENAGTGAMTSPATLADYIKWGVQNFPAQRYALILWDHGSGSVSGYGYDEKNAQAGSMSLSGLNQALSNGGVKFDFIGFDTCLMATVENALMCSKYADYLIASEETEPGIGWYYKEWLTELGKNPGLDTLDIGKKICDDFVSTCSSQCRGQETTLSVIDLAELEHTVPEKLTAFSNSVSGMIKNQEYTTVSKARSGSREFARSSRIDQVDLVDLCTRLNTTESKALANTLKGAVKYNNYNNISDAHGLSVYFPYQKAGNVNKAVSNYDAIGMDDSYGDCIRAFAQVAQSGQGVTGGSNQGYASLFGGGDYGAASGGDLMDLLGSFLGRSVTQEDEALVETLESNMLDASLLTFKQDAEDENSWVLELPAEQWALVNDIAENMFYDNGEGYIDLGIDQRYAVIFDKQGRLVADTEGAWTSIGTQPVAYYVESIQALDDGGFIVIGRIPALLSGARTVELDGQQQRASFTDQRVELIVYSVLDSEADEHNYVVGARPVYAGGETDTVPKAMAELEDGDVIQPIADFYDYDQNFVDAYRLGNPVTVKGMVEVTNVELPDVTRANVTYRFTDVYGQDYWTDVIGK